MTIDRKRLAFSLWLFLAAFIIYGAAFPFRFVADSDQVFAKLSHLPLNPLVSQEAGARMWADIFQNLLLFVPFGMLGFLAGNPAEPVSRRIAFAVLVGTGLSVLAEGLQLLTADRIASLNDVMFDTAGCILGAVSAWRFSPVLGAGLRRLRSYGLADAAGRRPFVVGSLLLVIAFWQPFDVSLDPELVARKIRILEEDVWQFPGLRQTGVSFVLSALFGMTLASYLTALRVRHVAMTTLVAGVASVCFLEAAQFFIDSRVPCLGVPLVASAGVGLGTAIWSVQRQTQLAQT